jgi:hypothetical protein
MSLRVLNLSTGLVHDVPPGHWSLTDAGYEVLAPEPEPDADELEPVRPKRARKS